MPISQVVSGGGSISTGTKQPSTGDVSSGDVSFEGEVPQARRGAGISPSERFTGQGGAGAGAGVDTGAIEVFQEIVMKMKEAGLEQEADKLSILLEDMLSSGSEGGSGLSPGEKASLLEELEGKM